MFEDVDPILDKVEAWARAKGDGSLIDIQRAFRIGYNRAAWLIETMTELKTVEHYHNGMSVRFRVPSPRPQKS